MSTRLSSSAPEQLFSFITKGPGDEGLGNLQSCTTTWFRCGTTKSEIKSSEKAKESSIEKTPLRRGKDKTNRERNATYNDTRVVKAQLSMSCHYGTDPFKPSRHTTQLLRSVPAFRSNYRKDPLKRPVMTGLRPLECPVFCKNTDRPV
jgi:hypothetical protein